MGYIRVAKLSDIVKNINSELPYSTYISSYEGGLEIDFNDKKTILGFKESPWDIVTLGDLRIMLNDGYNPLVVSGDPSLADNNCNLIMFCEISETNPTNNIEKGENKVLLKFITKLDLALTSSDLGTDLYCYILSIFLPNEYKDASPDSVVAEFFDSGMTIKDLDNVINDCEYEYFKEVYTNYKNYLLSAVKDINESYKNGWYPRQIMELKEREEYKD
ncbi:MAG: hypothetical protein J5525_12590 [Lachnospiraceae bacterium]|nr:hypothetical protein [Lachnospiraceae bacterium]